MVLCAWESEHAKHANGRSRAAASPEDAGYDRGSTNAQQQVLMTRSTIGIARFGQTTHSTIVEGEHFLAKQYGGTSQPTVKGTKVVLYPASFVLTIFFVADLQLLVGHIGLLIG